MYNWAKKFSKDKDGDKEELLKGMKEQEEKAEKKERQRLEKINKEEAEARRYFAECKEKYFPKK